MRVQPIYDRNGVDSPMSRFRHPCFPKTGTKPYAIAGERRSVGLFKRLGPRFQVVGSLTLMSAPDETVTGLRASPGMVRKLVKQWLEKSGDFCVVLRWNVGRHGHLRSQ